MLGGMRIPRVPPAMTDPMARFLLYLCSSMEGRAMSPIVTTAAPMMPTIAARRVLAITVAIASPPLIAPVHSRMVSYMSSTIPACCSILARKINRGMAKRRY